MIPAAILLYIVAAAIFVGARSFFPGPHRRVVFWILMVLAAAPALLATLLMVFAIIILSGPGLGW